MQGTIESNTSTRDQHQQRKEKEEEEEEASSFSKLSKIIFNYLLKFTQKKIKLINYQKIKKKKKKKAIEIKLIFGEYLLAFNFFQKLSIFVIASMAADDPTQKIQNNQLQRTQTDREGDGNPEWNHEIKFLIGEDLESDSDHLFIHLDLCHDGVLFGIGDRSIGEVRIPLKDLTDEASSNEVVRFVRYQVKSSYG